MPKDESELGRLGKTKKAWGWMGRRVFQGRRGPCTYVAEMGRVRERVEEREAAEVTWDKITWGLVGCWSSC